MAISYPCSVVCSSSIKHIIVHTQPSDNFGNHHQTSPNNTTPQLTSTRQSHISTHQRTSATIITPLHTPWRPIPGQRSHPLGLRLPMPASHGGLCPRPPSRRHRLFTEFNDGQPSLPARHVLPADITRPRERENTHHVSVWPTRAKLTKH